MGKKTPKDFKNNPFKNLKGFSASGQQDERPRPKLPPVEKKTESEPDFASAMDQLGVKKLPSVQILAPEKDAKAPAEIVSSTTREKSKPLSEEEEFLSALGQMDVRFADEVPSVDAPPAVPRRMKQLQRGKLSIDKTLDLHGLTRVEAEEKFRHFLVDADYQGWSTVRIVTGQGLHSQDQPVLRDAIETLLQREEFASVLEWGRAPQRQGGQGALVLFLRQRI